MRTVDPIQRTAIGAHLASRMKHEDNAAQKFGLVKKKKTVEERGNC
jgi:hypothetical protein